MPTTPPAALRHVWALPVRLAHWSLAALVAFNLFNESGAKLHRFAGYAAAAVVALRLIHGLLQKGSARPHLPRPDECLAHLRAMASGRVTRIAGHHALGAAMAWLLWLLVAALALTGWISRWDRFWGEDWPQDIHAALATALQVCVVLHLAGVALGSYLERQWLVRGMITGRKYVDPQTPPPRDLSR